MVRLLSRTWIGSRIPFLHTYGLDSEYAESHRKLDIVNSADSAFSIMKLLSFVSLDPHCIFILLASLSSLQIPREIPEKYPEKYPRITREIPEKYPEKYPKKYPRNILRNTKGIPPETPQEIPHEMPEKYPEKYLKNTLRNTPRNTQEIP